MYHENAKQNSYTFRVVGSVLYLLKYCIRCKSLRQIPASDLTASIWRYTVPYIIIITFTASDPLGGFPIPSRFSLQMGFPFLLATKYQQEGKLVTTKHLQLSNSKPGFFLRHLIKSLIYCS